MPRPDTARGPVRSSSSTELRPPSGTTSSPSKARDCSTVSRRPTLPTDAPSPRRAQRPPGASASSPPGSSDEFLKFLKQVAKAYPRVKLHLIVDNYATHKHPAVQAWLANNPRITMHFTPTSGSWLNMVEIFFGIITRQAIRRGTFTSVKDLIAAIETYINVWNERCQPFTWTKTADEILTKATGGQRSSFTRH